MQQRPFERTVQLFFSYCAWHGRTDSKMGNDIGHSCFHSLSPFTSRNIGKFESRLRRKLCLSPHTSDIYFAPSPSSNFCRREMQQEILVANRHNSISAGAALKIGRGAENQTRHFRIFSRPKKIQK